MSLQFADFNADGHKDIVTAIWEGTVFLVPGSKSGWKQPEYIKDAQDQLILLSRYYNVKAGKYDNATYPSGDATVSGDHLVSATAWDWDNDGDLDLLLGAKKGRLYLRLNNGKPGAPSFPGTNTLVKAGSGTFDVPGGLTAARTVDWDKDGVTDLVCGSFNGGAYLYRNTGRVGAPSFAAPISLLKPGKSPDGSAGPETGWYVDPVDFDGDGDLDLLVGGFFTLQPKPRKLNTTQKKRLEVVDADLKRLSTRMREFTKELREAITDVSPEERKAAVAKWSARPEVKSLRAKTSKLRAEQGELRPRPGRTSGVWLYRRQSAVGSQKPVGSGNKPGDNR